MPSPLEEIALRDLVKHPKLILVYAAFLGSGWLVDKIIPNDCQKEVIRWQSAFDRSEKRGDSLSNLNYQLAAQHVQDVITTRQQGQTIKTIDSLLNPIGVKAKEIIKNSKQ
jgi:hypothetical protein